jgi:hypothetical protein
VPDANFLGMPEAGTGGPAIGEAGTRSNFGARPVAVFAPGKSAALRKERASHALIAGSLRSLAEAFCEHAVGRINSRRRGGSRYRTVGVGPPGNDRPAPRPRLNCIFNGMSAGQTGL